MQMGPPTEQHQKLKALAGKWVGEETVHPTPWDQKGGTATARGTSRMDLGGFYLVSDYEQERGGQVAYRGHGVFGYDSNLKKYTMHWFDVMGCDPGAPALGTWEGNKLVFTHAHHMGHGRYTYEITGEGAYKFRMEHSQDGKSWMPFLDGTYKRVS